MTKWYVFSDLAILSGSDVQVGIKSDSGGRESQGPGVWAGSQVMV